MGKTGGKKTEHKQKSIKLVTKKRFRLLQQTIKGVQCSLLKPMGDSVDLSLTSFISSTP